jgi:hypothetical protein
LGKYITFRLPWEDSTLAVLLEEVPFVAVVALNPEEEEALGIVEFV